MTDRKEIFAKISDTTHTDEYFLPLPKGYQKGKTKYVIVMGTVMSGLGKGIFSSCLAKLLQDKGLKVAPIKLEGYLNFDSGTLNPFATEKCLFWTTDGNGYGSGTYERMLDQNLSRAIYQRQIYSSVLHKERHGDYLGRDVQMIPHVTGESNSNCVNWRCCPRRMWFCGDRRHGGRSGKRFLYRGDPRTGL